MVAQELYSARAEFRPEVYRFVILSRAYLQQTITVLQEVADTSYPDKRLDEYIPSSEAIEKSGKLMIEYYGLLDRLKEATMEQKLLVFTEMSRLFFSLTQQAVMQYGDLPLRGKLSNGYILRRYPTVLEHTTNSVFECVQQETVHFRKRIIEKLFAGAPVYNSLKDPHAKNPRAFSWSGSVLGDTLEHPEFTTKILYRFDEINLRGLRSLEGRWELAKIVAHAVGAVGRLRYEIQQEKNGAV